MHLGFYDGCTLDEIRAYRNLESATFNFGEGNMSIDGWYGSEDAYYEMCLPEECGWEWDDLPICPNEELSKHKYKMNRYAKKRITNHKLKYLMKYGSWYTVGEHKGFLQRYYPSKRGRAKKLKKYSNRIVRRRWNLGISDRSCYKKVFDYWWELY